MTIGHFWTCRSISKKREGGRKDPGGSELAGQMRQKEERRLRGSWVEFRRTSVCV